MPLATLVYATLHSGICHFPFWHMPLSILVYPTSILGYVHHMSICKDIITKLLSQNVLNESQESEATK